jgi:hypothetical protein
MQQQRQCKDTSGELGASVLARAASMHAHCQLMRMDVPAAAHAKHIYKALQQTILHCWLA